MARARGWKMGTRDGEELLRSFWECPVALCHRKRFPHARELWLAGPSLSPILAQPALLCGSGQASGSLWTEAESPCPVHKKLELRALELTLEAENPTQMPREGQRSVQGHIAGPGIPHKGYTASSCPYIYSAPGLSTVRGTGPQLSTEVLPYP